MTRIFFVPGSRLALKLKTFSECSRLFMRTLSIFLILVSFLIPFIYDVRFAPSKAPLVILASGIPFFFLSALLWHVLIIFDRQKNLVLVYGAGALFNLIVNLIFIPRFGYIAAAVTTVVSEAFILLLLIVIVLSASKLKTANSYD